MNQTLEKNISIYSILFIHFLFAWKYLQRLTEYGFLLALLSSIFILFILKLNITFRKPKVIKWLILFLFGVGFMAVWIVFVKTDLNALKVDRWSVISSFWDAFFNGHYPYFASSHLNNPPGPMPFYFIIFLPFYLLKAYAFAPLVGVAILSIFCFKNDWGYLLHLKMLVFMFCSFYFIWETLVGSTVLLNSVLGLLVFILVQNSFQKQTKNILIAGVSLGIILSTRMVFVLPFIVFFASYFFSKQFNLKQFLIFSMAVIFSFCISFLPFVLPFYNDFFKMNPFIIQSGFLMPSYFTLLFAIIAFIMGAFWGRKTALVFLAGLSLFSSIVIYFVYHLITDGPRMAYIESGADISYFIFCIPFFLYSYFQATKTNFPLNN